MMLIFENTGDYMGDLIPKSSIDSSNIRREWQEGKWYYSAIDIVAVLLNMNHKQAQNYYHVFKKQLSQNGENIPEVQKFKAYSVDDKMYYTDFTTATGVRVLRGYLEPKKRNQQNRRLKRKDDEVLQFHPKVIAYLNQRGFEIRHHVRLNSQSVIDLVAVTIDTMYIIECKPNLAKGNLFTAIGQVLCYRNEYSVNATPAIASYSNNISDYAQQSCGTLGIQLIGIPNE
jgi:hypothetical protein